VWQDDELIAGTFGTGMGRVFTVDSAFTRCPDAAKVATAADLARRLGGSGDLLIDVQVPSGYTTELGARPIGREAYLAALLDVDLPLVPATGQLPVGPLGAGGE